jgi:hypothetical protein
MFSLKMETSKMSKNKAAWIGFWAVVLPALIGLLGTWYYHTPTVTVGGVSVGGNNSGDVITGGRDVTVHKNSSSPASELSGLLLPGNQTIPAEYQKLPVGAPKEGAEGFAKSLKDLENDFKIYLGSDVCAIDHYGDITVLRMDGKDLVKLRVTAEGVYLSATVIREDGRVVAQIVDNKYEVNPNNYFKSPILEDKSTIAIRDKNGVEVLRASFLNEKAFEVLGVFEMPGSQTLHVTRDSIKLGGTRFRNNIARNTGAGCFSFGKHSALPPNKIKTS